MLEWARCLSAPRARPNASTSNGTQIGGRHGFFSFPQSARNDQRHPESETLVGTLGNNTINGFAGNDFLFGDKSGTLASLGGSDTLDGGNGNDALYGDAMDIVYGGRGGNDVLSGGLGSNTLYGDAVSIVGSQADPYSTVGATTSSDPRRRT